MPPDDEPRCARCGCLFGWHATGPDGDESCARPGCNCRRFVGATPQGDLFAL